MDIEKRLRECGIVLPEVSVPLAAYLPAVRSGNLLFISGQPPMEQGFWLTRADWAVSSA